MELNPEFTHAFAVLDSNPGSIALDTAKFQATEFETVFGWQWKFVFPLKPQRRSNGQHVNTFYKKVESSRIQASDTESLLCEGGSKISWKRGLE